MNQSEENPLRTLKKFPVKLFIGQIPKIWNEQELKKFFSNFGIVQDAQVIRDPTGNHKGCAFVTFSSITEADIAIEALNEVFFKKATAKLQLKWADGEARKFGITNMNTEHANKILINNIPVNFQQQFVSILDKFGLIRIKKFLPYKNDPNKVFCFIKFTTKEQAIGAVKELHNYNFQGNNIGCFFASQLLSKEFLDQNNQVKQQDFSQAQYLQKQQEPEIQSNVFYEFKDPSGSIYYFNPAQNKSQWEKPTEEDAQILPEEAYYNKGKQKTTSDYTAQILGKDNDNFVNVLAKGIPEQWTREDFLAFCQTYNANIVYTEVLNAENVQQANIQKRFEAEQIGVIKFKEIFEAENFIKKLNNQKLGTNILSLEIVN